MTYRVTYTYTCRVVDGTDVNYSENRLMGSYLNITFTKDYYITE